MKITFEIDCTPEEARRFLGMMDVSAVNEAVTDELARQVSEIVGSMDPKDLADRWLATGSEGLGELQKQFFERFFPDRNRG